jgi:Predicted esterase
MTDVKLGFVHRYIPPAEKGSSVTLLLLHGTGGSENDLLPLGAALAPEAGMLSPRGKVLENGMPRFFRRLAMGVFDQEDLQLRTRELGEFIEAASRAYGFDRNAVVAVGYSNGANIAGSLMLRRPDLLAAAVLLRPMVSFVPEEPPDLSGKAVFLGAARHDPIVTPEETMRVERLFRECGAEVFLQWQLRGHEMGQEEVPAIRDWLAGWGARTGHLSIRQ